MSTAPHTNSNVLFLDLGQNETAATHVETVDDLVTRLFEQLRLPIYRFLVSRYGRPTDAEELTQEVFIRMYGAIAEGQRIDNHRAWAFRVAHNLAVNRALRQPPVLDVDEAAWSHLCRTRADEAPSPEQRLLTDERRMRVRALAAQLSELQRGCLLLRVEGFRYREIGEILGLSISTVAESIRRGIRRLSRVDDD